MEWTCLAWRQVAGSCERSKERGIPWLAEVLLAFQEGLFSTELVNDAIILYSGAGEFEFLSRAPSTVKIFSEVLGNSVETNFGIFPPSDRESTVPAAPSHRYKWQAVTYRGGFGVFKPPPPEIPKALQNLAKLNPNVKTVKSCILCMRVNSGLPRGVWGVQISKALRNRPKLNPTVKTVENCWTPTPQDVRKKSQ